MNSWRLFAIVLVLPVLFTALVLSTVVRNRAGGREAIELTDRELSLSGATDENSGIAARLLWSREWQAGSRWLSPETLQSVGFAVTADGDASARQRFYARQLQRRAYIAFELRNAPERRSRLVPVDASRDRDELLAKYPNGRTHLITSGFIGIRFDDGPGGAVLDGYVVSLDPAGIHVPTELAERLRPGRGRAQTFTMSVRYGSRLIPRIVDVR